MRGRKHILSLLSLASAVVTSQGVSWGGAGSWKPSNYWLDPLSGQRPVLSSLSSPLHPVCSHSIHLNLAGSKCLSFTNKVMNNKSKGFLGTISLYLWHLKTVNGPCNCYWKQFHALAAGSQGDLRLRAPHVCQIFMPGLVKARSQKSSARPLSLSSDWHTWVEAK